LPIKRLVLAEKRAIERGNRQPLPEPADFDLQKARMPFRECVTTKWWPAWKNQHPSSEYGARKKVESASCRLSGIPGYPFGDLTPVQSWPGRPR
jgi:hypothetical protein